MQRWCNINTASIQCETITTWCWCNVEAVKFFPNKSSGSRGMKNIQLKFSEAKYFYKLVQKSWMFLYFWIDFLFSDREKWNFWINCMCFQSIFIFQADGLSVDELFKLLKVLVNINARKLSLPTLNTIMHI